jgi:hypothetical protein
VKALTALVFNQWIQRLNFRLNPKYFYESRRRDKPRPFWFVVDTRREAGAATEELRLDRLGVCVTCEWRRWWTCVVFGNIKRTPPVLTYLTLVILKLEINWLIS